MKRLAILQHPRNLLVIIMLVIGFNARAQFYDPDRIVKLKVTEMNGYQLTVKDGKLTGDSVPSVHIIYNKNGNQLKTTIADDSTLHYYNEKGKEIKNEHYQRGRVEVSIINMYDEKGLLASRVSKYLSGVYTDTYKYNKFGRVTEVNTVGGKSGISNKIITQYIGNTNKVFSVHSETNDVITKKTANLVSKYNSKHQLVHEVNLYYTLSPVKEVIKFDNRYVYTNSGKIKFVKIFKNDTLTSDQESYFDKRGNEIKTFNIINGKRMLMATYTFNNKNQNVKMMQMNGISNYPLTPDGKSYDASKPATTTYYECLTYFTYNSDGCISSRAEYRNTSVLFSMYKYYYKKQN
ncbi:MAG: hypothetical protein ABIN91_06390 [Mucilaginibacter sp.]|uniref:hypothetical protein n=1 Tax=Mucilaginibacter sp. TaxID=1882438 RepID=UPI003265F4A5